MDEDVLIVVPDPADPARGRLRLGELSWPCALGRTGTTIAKTEGDGATPEGEFPLRLAFYRPDRLRRPATRLRLKALTPRDGWCDDPQSPSYNRWIALPAKDRHERLWREDGLYDLVAVIGWNDEPPEPEGGSAIFLHVATPDYSPTAGCVAVARDDLLEILAQCHRGTRIRIGSSAPAAPAEPEGGTGP